MNSKYLFDKYDSLTNNEKKEVLNFIEFLSSKKQRSKKKRMVASFNLEKEEFIGMWEKRIDMEASTSWVRNSRKSEWAD
jgi:hypothetical protein